MRNYRHSRLKSNAHQNKTRSSQGVLTSEETSTPPLIISLPFRPTTWTSRFFSVPIVHRAGIVCVATLNTWDPRASCKLESWLRDPPNGDSGKSSKWRSWRIEDPLVSYRSLSLSYYLLSFWRQCRCEAAEHARISRPPAADTRLRRRQRPKWCWAFKKHFSWW